MVLYLNNLKLIVLDNIKELGEQVNEEIEKLTGKDSGFIFKS